MQGLQVIVTRCRVYQLDKRNRTWVPAMDVPIAHPVSAIACTTIVAFVFKLLVSIIVFSFLSLTNKY